MKRGKPLAAAQLYRHCDPAIFSFESTAELDRRTSIPGQQRAIEAIQFSMESEPDGFNLFVLGSAGSGRHHLVRQILEQQAAARSAADDWCYVNNFANPQKPRALRLPAGWGNDFKKEIEQLIEEAGNAISAALESEDFQTRQQAIEEEFKEQQSDSFNQIKAHAEARKIAIVETPTGFTFTPLLKGDDGREAEFDNLSEQQKLQIQKDIEELSLELRRFLQSTPKRLHEARRRSRELEQEVSRLTLGGLTDEIFRKYRDHAGVMTHLQRMQSDIVEHVELFRTTPEQKNQMLMSLLEGQAQGGSTQRSAVMQRFEINLLIDHNDHSAAPVVFEDHPTFSNLIGRVEHQARMGVLTTDFHMIRAGALHRANGGYLVLDVRKVLMQPLAWEGLKQALKSRQIKIRSLGEDLSLISTASLEPEPIPLRVKVVLMGERIYYYLLQKHDPEFQELFKVAADFEDDFERNDHNSRLFAHLIAEYVSEDKLRPLDKFAVARLLEESSRHAGDAEKLSGQVRYATDIVREAHYWADKRGKDVIGSDEIQSAIDARIRRVSRIRDRMQEEMLRDTILIATAGVCTGQVNGLSVLQLGEYAFGRPSRITARVSLGAGKVVDIEREVELGGPIHSKGVLILTSFLVSHYLPDQPLSLHASLVFEQSYSGVEGDSASAAELCALLSALAETPIKQSMAITGSVNQFGQIQPIGGVNEKIEGFFDLCNRRGLTGEQGVLIPSSNVKHLMLRRDVIDAVEQGRFNIYPVESVDQCLELLTGTAAGAPSSAGEFPEGSVNGRVRARLIDMAQKRRAFTDSGKQEGAS